MLPGSLAADAKALEPVMSRFRAFGLAMAIATVSASAPALSQSWPSRPVALISEQPIVLMTRHDLPADDLKGFIAFAKANQADMKYGSAGAGSAVQLACVLLNAAIGVGVTHVPYRGSAPAMQDLIAGRID